jgi:glyoxylase-like metal-dependent hydrolase (beta-lactamase superfamily II)
VIQDESRGGSELQPAPRLATGRGGRRYFAKGDAAYAQLLWTDPLGTGSASYDLLPGVATALDQYVTRLIAPNPSIMTGPGTNTYLIGEREVAVVDPGPDDPTHIAAILEAGAGRIRWILCTHTHHDHAEGVAAIQSATGAQVLGRAGPDSEYDIPLKLDRVVEEGERIPCDSLSVRAVLTPGHSSNHVCYLLEETRMLFTGDHIMQGSTVVILPPDGSMHAYLSSLKRLLALDIAILAPGHGYLIGQPEVEIDRLVKHRLAREDKVRRALREAGSSASLQTLLPRVYDDVPVALHPMAARSLEAHLDKLVVDGEIAQADGLYAFR